MKPFQILQIFIFALFCLFSINSQAQSNLLVFGDSLSAGYGIPREAAWVSLLQESLKNSHPHYKVVNASISGETTSGGVQRFPNALHEHRPNIVILELGANDGLRGNSLTLTEKNLNTLIQQALDGGAKVLLLGMQLPPNYGTDYAKKFKSLYPKLAHQKHITLVPFMLEGVSADLFLEDNLHPNAQAQAIILKTVMQKLRPLL
jgi:acyl-CoA thioesterase I